MMRAPHGRRAAALALAILLPGCAAMTPDLKPPGSTPAPSTATGGAAPTAPEAVSASARSAAAIPATDSLPSPEAQRVLASIPEPLDAAERVPPPLVHAPDSTRVRVDSTQAGVPVPAETAPLGQTPADVQRMTSPDSALATTAAGAARGGDPGSGTGAAGATAAGAGAAMPAASAKPSAGAPDVAPGAPCFKLQVGAPSDAKKADGLKRAASSQLEVEFEIVHVKNLYKVRTHDCFGREAVDALRARAVAAGFPGVFAVATSAK
jgi:hypothetical protein